MISHVVEQSFESYYFLLANSASSVAVIMRNFSMITYKFLGFKVGSTSITKVHLWLSVNFSAAGDLLKISK